MKHIVPVTITAEIIVNTKWSDEIPEDVAGNLIQYLVKHCDGELTVIEAVYGQVRDASNLTQEGDKLSDTPSTGILLPVRDESGLKIEYLNGYQDHS